MAGFAELIQTAYAKSSPPQSIASHNDDLKTVYQRLVDLGYITQAMATQWGPVITLIIDAHDLGKINGLFQTKIIDSINKRPRKRDPNELYHEWLSAQLLTHFDTKVFEKWNRENHRFIDVVRYIIAFHHTRKDCLNNHNFKKRLEHLHQHDDNLKGRLLPARAFYDPLSIQKRFWDELVPLFFNEMVWLKGLLHKCDYSASSNDPSHAEKPWRGGADREADYRKRLTFTPRPFQTLARPLRDCSVVMTAPTGLGKTEFSQLWIDGDKAFYTLGLRTAVNKMWHRFKDRFGENVEIWHGESAATLVDEMDNGTGFDATTLVQRLTRTRLLANPITICTGDQLMTAALKYNGFELIYFTLSYSKVVVDEIQSYSPESMAIIVTFLSEIHRLGGRFLLMTATLPQFLLDDLTNLITPKDVSPQWESQRPKPELTDAIRSQIIISHTHIDQQFVTLKPPADPQTSTIRHHVKRYPSNLIIGNESPDLILLLEALTGRPTKILITVNTVGTAQSLFRILLERGFNPKLIHSRFIGQDRAVKENEIYQDAQNGTQNSEGCIWIATQIVEASLDIDFDHLITEICPVESLFQRMGRCFRSRELPETSGPNVHIFNATPASRYVYTQDMVERTDTILGTFTAQTPRLTESDKTNLLNEIYQLDAIKTSSYYLDYKKYLNLLRLGFRAQNKPDAQAVFRKITNQYTVIPISIYNENQSKIQEILTQLQSRETELADKIRIRSELLSYTVPVRVDGDNINLLVRPTCTEGGESIYAKKMGIWVIKGCQYTFDMGMAFEKNHSDIDDRIL